MDEQIEQTWWCAREYSEYNPRPVPVTVTKVTPKFITYRSEFLESERRQSIRSSYENFFPSKEGAYDWMLEQEVFKLSWAQERMETASLNIEALKALKEASV